MIVDPSAGSAGLSQGEAVESNLNALPPLLALTTGVQRDTQESPMSPELIDPKTFRTSRDGVFAGGDVATGPAELSESINSTCPEASPPSSWPP